MASYLVPTNHIYTVFSASGRPLRHVQLIPVMAKTMPTGNRVLHKVPLVSGHLGQAVVAMPRVRRAPPQPVADRVEVAIWLPNGLLACTIIDPRLPMRRLTNHVVHSLGYCEDDYEVVAVDRLAKVVIHYDPLQPVLSLRNCRFFLVKKSEVDSFRFQESFSLHSSAFTDDGTILAASGMTMPDQTTGGGLLKMRVARNGDVIRGASPAVNGARIVPGTSSNSASRSHTSSEAGSSPGLSECRIRLIKSTSEVIGKDVIVIRLLPHLRYSLEGVDVNSRLREIFQIITERLNKTASDWKLVLTRDPEQTIDMDRALSHYDTNEVTLIPILNPTGIVLP